MRLYQNGEPVELEVEFPVTDGGDRVYVRTPEGVFSGVAVAKGDAIFVSYRGQTFRFERTPRRRSAEAAAGSGNLTAPMPGLIVEVLAAQGDHLPKGAKLLVLEAMKTQLPILMPFEGKVASILVTAGQQVDQDAPLACVEPGESTG